MWHQAGKGERELMWGEASGRGGVSPAAQVWCQKQEVHVSAAADGVQTPEKEGEFNK